MAATSPELLNLGRRVRQLRRAQGLTLRELGERVGRTASSLSLVENGKREPGFSLVEALAQALGVGVAELAEGDIVDRRAQLEIALQLAQEESLYRSLGLAHLDPPRRVPDEILEHIITLYRQLSARVELSTASTEGAREANAALRVEMRSRDNYYDDIEQSAEDALRAVGWQGAGAISERTILDLAGHFGFEVRRVADVPRRTRSVTDLRNRVVYIPQRNAAPTRAARSLILQVLGRFALGHENPVDFAEYLRQQVEANYFAGAVLAPKSAVLPFLADAKRRHDLSIEDLKEVFYISYEMAAHRFTNVATRHLGLRVHFLKADAEGAILKAYENDGLPFTTDPSGAIEGQRACRFWGARTAFLSEDAFDIHYQHTETPAGTYWSATHIETDQSPLTSISVGVRDRDALYFRGARTAHRQRSTCPDPQCCRQPSADVEARWGGMFWPAPLQHASMLATFPVGPIPGVDLAEVLEFLEHRTTRRPVAQPDKE